jgi:steroid 5-alpha reductase family enzyme
MNVWVLIGLGLNAAVALMALAWVLCRCLNNASYVDVIWSYGFVIVTALFAILGAGAPPRKTLIVAMVTVWSLRLGTRLLIRIIRHHPLEVERYAALREQFPKRPWMMFFGFFQLQAFQIGLLAVPFAIACSNPSPSLHLWEIAGTVLWLLAFGGEALADQQLNRFRSDPANKGQVCRRGLWNFSRHPNTFCEWLVWIAYFLFALGTPGGWIAIYCPLLMWYFLTQVTGIPPAEARSLKSCGEAYRDYQRTTNRFFPWWPKRS